ncbi:MAG: nucleotide exchange factor GrpE [Candidatus Lindowbacteria bacterium]|nr:nucleotide exchange factor GrpE [Candidatus Lindowbacteria bacterium]
MNKRKEPLNNKKDLKKKPDAEQTAEQPAVEAGTSQPAPQTESEIRKQTKEEAEAPCDGEVAEPELAEPEAPKPAEGPALSPDEIAKLIKEKEEYYDLLLRTQADFDNYRKRVQKETANLLKYGAENALREILPVIDNLDRALDSARKHTESNSRVIEGIELILAQFRGVLQKLGVKTIETVGHAFDPNKHDALLRVHAPGVAEGAVLDEIRKGYYFHDKVLRPAQVTVGTQEGPLDSGHKPEEP